jgi:hypothetical protein
MQYKLVLFLCSYMNAHCNTNSHAHLAYKHIFLAVQQKLAKSKHLDFLTWQSAAGGLNFWHRSSVSETVSQK